MNNTAEHFKYGVDQIRAVDISTVQVRDPNLDGWPTFRPPIEPYIVRLPDDLTPRYLVGPITPHLLRLKKGDADSIKAFVARLGWLELRDWVRGITTPDSQGRELWEQTVQGDLDAEERVHRIVAAWVHPNTEGPFSDSQGMLRIAWESAGRNDWSDDKRLDWLSGFYRNPADFGQTEYGPANQQAIRLRLVTRGNPMRLVAMPADIFARSYLELAELLGRRLRSAVCEYCGQWFPPTRDGQRFCPGSSCKKNHDAAYAKHPYRRAYQRMYQRFRRGTLAPEEWDAWRDRNRGPDQWKAENDE